MKVLRCANPECTARFDYREGQLLRVRLSSSGEEVNGTASGVRHFWLCGECCLVYALSRDPRKGVLITRQFAEEKAGDTIKIAASA